MEMTGLEAMKADGTGDLKTVEIMSMIVETRVTIPAGSVGMKVGEKAGLMEDMADQGMTGES